MVKSYLPRDQVKSYTCGPVALANALALYGIATSQEECQGACGSGTDGTGEDQLLMGIRAMGFYPIVKEVLKKDAKTFNKLLNWVRTQTDLGRFAICSINGNGPQGHWILIERVTRRGIHIWNPSLNYSYVVPKKNLFKAWWNVNLPEFNLDSCVLESAWVVALAPRTKLTKRAVEVRYNQINPPVGLLPTEKVKLP